MIMSEEKILELLINYANAQEAAAVDLKHRIAELVGVETSPSVKYSESDFDKLFWERLKGAKGPFQRTSKKSTQNHPVFQALQTILKKHSGFCHIGSYKYWFDQGNPDRDPGSGTECARGVQALTVAPPP